MNQAQVLKLSSKVKIINLKPSRILGISDFESRASSIAFSAKTWKLSHAEILEKINEELYKEVGSVTPKGRNRYSLYMKGYVSALAHGITRNIMTTEVEYCYVINGEFYTTSKEETGKKKTNLLYGQEGNFQMITPQHVFDNAEKGFFWKGTEKKYS